MKNTNEEQEETSFQLFEIAEDEAIFEPLKKVNGIAGNFLSFETIQDDEDGTFPLVLHYINLIKRMETDGVSAFLNWIAGRRKDQRLNFNNGYCTVIRKTDYTHEATLIFKKPIRIQVAELNGEPILIEANKITGEFTYEWFWVKNGRQEKYANGVTIYFDCQKYELI